jgi:hypothetical protein
LKKTEGDERVGLPGWLSEVPLNRQATCSWGAL